MKKLDIILVIIAIVVIALIVRAHRSPEGTPTSRESYTPCEIVSGHITGSKPCLINGDVIYPDSGKGA